jgi:hypothetical protein
MERRGQRNSAVRLRTEAAARLDDLDIERPDAFDKPDVGVEERTQVGVVAEELVHAADVA